MVIGLKISSQFDNDMNYVEQYLEDKPTKKSKNTRITDLYDRYSKLSKVEKDKFKQLLKND